MFLRSSCLSQKITHDAVTFAAIWKQITMHDTSWSCMVITLWRMSSVSMREDLGSILKLAQTFPESESIWSAKPRQGSKKTVPALHKWWPWFRCFQAHVDNSTLCSGCFKIAGNKIMQHHAYCIPYIECKNQGLGVKWIMRINKDSNIMRSFCIFPDHVEFSPRPRFANVQGQSMIERYWKMLLPTVLSN